MRSLALGRVEGGSLARFQKVRRLSLFALLAVTTSALLFCSSLRIDSPLHEFVETVGAALIVLAIAGRLWSTIYIGGRKNAEIVSRGPYSLTRNPLYVFSAIGAVGVGAQTGSITVAVLFGIATVIAFHVVIRREERFLREKFGAAFDRYCADVPRFFPKLSGYDGAGLVTVDPARLWTTLLDGLVFFAAVPAFEGIEWLQQIGVLRILLRLP